MRVKEMHPLCCINLESARGGAGDWSPAKDPNAPTSSLARTRSLPVLVGSDDASDPPSYSSASGDSAVAGVMYKWTNFGKGWRSRWFLLDKRDGSLSYSRSRLMYDGVQLIGDPAGGGSCGGYGSGRRRHLKKTGVVRLKGKEREVKSGGRNKKNPLSLSQKT